MPLLLDWLVQPLTLVFLALLFSQLWLLLTPGISKSLKVISASATVVLWLCSAPLTANALVLKIESRTDQASKTCESSRQGAGSNDLPVVVLGADLDAYGESDNPYEVLSPETLARTFHAATLDTGTNDFYLLGGGRTSRKLSDFMARVLISAGVDEQQITRERISLSTKENAEQLAVVMPSGSARQIVLVTSALHMRRAVNIFNDAGFISCPSPANSLYSVSAGWVGLLPYITSLNKTTQAWRELLATLKYHLGSFANSL